MTTTVTYTIKPSGGNYSSISGWIAGVQSLHPNLVTDDVVVEGACYAQALNDDAIAISSVTTDATRYLRLFCPVGEGHTGVSRDVTGTGFQLISSGAGGLGAIRLGSVQYFRIEGLEIKSTYSGTTLSSGNCVRYDFATVSAGANSHLISGCLLQAATTASADYIINASIANLVFTLQNSILYSSGTARAIDVRLAASGALYFNTFQTASADRGFIVSSAFTLKNNWAGGASGPDFITSNTFTGSNNASHDATGDDANMSSGAKINLTASNQFNNVSFGSSANYLLKTGNALAGAGVAVTGITTDIVGNTRPSPPSIGAADVSGGLPFYTTRKRTWLNILQTGP